MKSIEQVLIGVDHAEAILDDACRSALQAVHAAADAFHKMAQTEGEN